MTPAIPKIAIVGRRNVGKSTLANRLFGARALIAHDTPGVTRDAIELETSWRGRRFGLIDTAGYMHGSSGIEATAMERSMRAAAEADLVLLVTDVRSGVTQDDADLAGRLRRSPTPILVVANKVDADSDLADVPALYALGAGEPVPISALHGRGIGELLDRIVDLLPQASEDEAIDQGEPRFAIVGRPNVGKSALFNAVLGADRAIVSDEPGTTRDPVDSVVTWPGHGPVRFVDTAGMRRGGKVRGVEYYSYLRTIGAIERAHVVLLVLDAVDGFTGADKRIAASAIEAGRAVLVVANKWDLVEERDRRYKELEGEAQPFARAQVVRTSATGGLGVHRLPPVLMDLHRRWNLRVPTPTANAILQEARSTAPSPSSSGALRYVSQVSTAPPTLVFFGADRAVAPSYRRYLENRFRERLDWQGVPVRMHFRGRRRSR